jgi:glycosyltransferase involved in cell wall biosynthesis
MAELSGQEVTALVPCHRRPPSAGLLEGILAQVGAALVVDDGMGEEGRAELERIAAPLGAATLHLGANLGKGHALAAGIRVLRGAGAVLTVDCDGQHPPAAIPRFLDAAAGADLVVGNRFADGADGMPPLRLTANRLSSRLVSLTARTPVPDSQCGMRLLHRRALQVPFPPGGMESETHHLLACLRAGLPIHWVPIPAIYEGHPTSFRPLRDSLTVLRAALAL